MAAADPPRGLPIPDAAAPDAPIDAPSGGETSPVAPPVADAANQTPPVCTTGYADCAPAIPGCETTLGTDENCSACGHKCGSTERCQNAHCTCIATCGDICADLQGDPTNCGTCNNTCPAACTNGHCVCPTPDPANLVRNGGFDRDLSNWNTMQPFQPTANATFSGRDAAECGGSGAIVSTYGKPRPTYVISSRQCIDGIDAAKDYDIGGWVSRLTVGMYSCQVMIDWYPQTGCQASSPRGDGAFMMDNNTTTGVWRHVTGKFRPPPGTRSGEVQVQMTAFESSEKAFQCAFDMVYVTPSPGGW
jgi:hypothetical protein